MKLPASQNRFVGGALALITALTGCGAAEVAEKPVVPGVSAEVAVPRGHLRQRIVRALGALHDHYHLLSEKKNKVIGGDFRLGSDKEDQMARCMGVMRGQILAAYDEAEPSLHDIRAELARCSSMELDRDVSFGCSADIAMGAGKGAAYLKSTEQVTAALASGIRCLDEIP